MKHRVLIADLANSDGVSEIPGLFRKAGCEVSVFCPRGSWLLKNSSWDRHILPEDLSPQPCMKHLEEEALSGRYDWIVLADDHISALAREYILDEESLKRILPISDLGHRGLIGSKAGLHLACQEYGIISPRGTLYSTDRSEEEMLEHLSFPILLKLDQGGGGQGVFRCDDKAAMKERLAKFTSAEKEKLLIQEYVRGDIVSVEALFRGGILLAAANSKVLKNVDGEFAISMVREYSGHSGAEAAIESAGRALGFNGFCSSTFIFEKSSQKYYLIEADLRPQAWYSLARFAGVDFSLAISAYLLGKDALAQKTVSDTKNILVVRHFSRSILNALQNRDVAEIFRWIFNREGRWKYVPISDPRLFAATLLGICKMYLFPFYARILRRSNI